MSEEKEKQINNFSRSNCVIRDDDHGWGGPDPEAIELTEKKIKDKPTYDEPINWPFNRFR